MNVDQVYSVSNFINHACSPNLRYDSYDDMVAIRDIAAGEELYVWLIANL